MRSFGTKLVVDPFPARALAGRRCRRQLQVGQRRAQVETGAADDDRSPARPDDLVDREISSVSGTTPTSRAG